MEAIAKNFAEKYGFVVVPTRFKFPKGIAGWQKLTKSYSGPKWKNATGYGIVTGKVSRITVIDVDEPSMAWFNEFWKAKKFEPTCVVKTPGGGCHVYFKYDERINGCTKLHGMAVDPRNDGQLVCGPGSLYETKDDDKKEFNGNEYVFQRREHTHVEQD